MNRKNKFTPLHKNKSAIFALFIVKIVQKSPQVVKHVVKCEKWVCSTLKAGKNKHIDYIAKTRDLARICEKIKEKRGFVMNPRFGLSATLR